MPFTPPSSFSTRPDLRGAFGMASSTHWLATAAAQSVLERGGNAFDAAVAGGFVLHVVEPHLNGPGGDLTGLFATAGRPGEPVVLMGQGPAPAGATAEHCRAEGLDLVPGAGALAAAVPGAVDAWFVLLRDHGTWELADVLALAAGYARDGHPVLGRVGATIAAVSGLFAEHWPSSARQWMPAGRPPAAGEMIRNEAYARVLERLVAAGAGARTREARIEAARRVWREGFVAEAAAAFVSAPHRHSSGTDHAGVLTVEDFASFEAGYEPAATLEFRGHTVAKTGPWGQGPVLLQALAILDGFDDDRLDPSTALGAHTVLEALKLALADREAWYGDDDVPLGHLLSPAYAAERRALITDTASHELRPGRVPGREPFLPPLRTEHGGGDTSALPAAGEPTVRPTGETRGDTCHIDVVDRWGGMVAVTPSGGWLQSSPTIPGLGFCLGTRLQMTWLEGGPSRLTPGKRPRTTLSPTLVLRDGHAVAALGSPGGDQQDQWQLPWLLRTLVGGWTPQQAVDAPTLHTTSVPGSFWPRTWEPGGAVVEDRLGEHVLADLARRGHRVVRAGDWSLGRLSVVTRDPATGVVGAAADPRGVQGYAAGR
ncbi:transferase [Kocuria dechangensis]|uniref:Transferase n=2 Tax=Kocuria dechangensis TaxID=1176249 RepID=A0A917H0F2_9MICC|nr:transferase [Kocuria dechangensis]